MNSNDKEIVNLRQLSCFISHHVHCFGFPAIFGIFPPFLVFWREIAANRSHDLNYIIITHDDVIISPHPIKTGCTCVH